MTMHGVTGATSFTGRFIAKRLTEAGYDVRNLTRADLAEPDRMAAALDGADTLTSIRDRSSRSQRLAWVRPWPAGGPFR